MVIIILLYYQICNMYCQIKMSQLSSFFKDILEVLDKIMHGTRVLAGKN
jgi:hypothetical protein